ncbi:MAG: MMPL family transporter [Thermoleophilaceae bacterium]|nr:MMPL family transporter [Thermoleophilaceae bacterium]
MRRWTRAIIRNRRKILVAWAAVFVLGAAGAANLGDLLTNRFSVPGSEAERGLDIAKQRFGEHGDGNFTLVLQATGGSTRDPAFVSAAGAAARRAAGAIDGGKAGPLLQAGGNVAYVQITTPLENADASKKTPDVRRAVGTVPGARTYVSGFPAINHDTQKIYNEDLARGESIAIPVALIVMAFMFGTLAGIAVPFAFALVSIPTTLGIVFIFAHFMDMAIYVTNIVTLVGFAIAIDYSMLVVFRYREELERHDHPHAALERTMATAGRATLFSGMTVAIGLALLVLMPLPFMRSMGVGGLMVPLVSIAASATFLPALLAVMGRRINRLRIVPRRVLKSRAQVQAGFWTRLAHSIMRRPVPYFVTAAAILLALAFQTTDLSLTGGDNRGVPKTTESTRGLAVLERTLGPGALAPNQIVVDTHRPGGAWTEASLAAQRRLIAQLRRDPQVVARTIQAPGVVAGRPGPPDAVTRARLREASLVDATGQAYQIRVAGRRDSGTHAAMDLVDRLRDRYVPAAGFGSASVYVSGAPAFGVDFIDRAYAAFPWLIVGVLVISYLLLMRAFRSLFLPAKAVVMNLLSVSATYGVLVLAFQHGWGNVLGWQSSPQIEAWIPIFLFAILFGLSMDYEVFLLSRMREEWDRRHDNEQAIARGLEHTGRIITAAAIIMVAAFSGFTAGSFVGLQQFGLGLSAAILLDATLVRAVLVPAAMKLVGDWNWYLPERARRALRLRPLPAPLGARAEAMAGAESGGGNPSAGAERPAAGERAEG